MSQQNSRNHKSYQSRPVTRPKWCAMGLVVLAVAFLSNLANAQQWNINFAGRDAANVLVADGTDPIGLGGGTWNNLISPEDGSGGFAWDPASPLTIVEANGGSSIGLDWGPGGSLNDHASNTGGPALTELNQGWFGFGNFDQTLNFTNVPAGSYDVTVYFTWRWNEQSTDYQITQGSGSDLGPKTLTPSQANAANFLSYTEGENYVTFREVSPASGNLDLRAFNTADGGFNAIQITPAAPPQGKFTAVVNTSSGEVTLQNNSLNPVVFDYYLLGSEGNALNPSNAPAGWNSLDDQGFDAGLAADFDGSGGAVDATDLAAWTGDYAVNGDSDADNDGDSDGSDFLTWQVQNGNVAGAGDSWDEAGGSSSSQLAELFLNSATTIGVGESISLGNAFDTSAFGAGNDGDLTFQFGVADGPLLTGDVQYVSSAAAASVPEPTTLALAVFMAALSAASGRNRRGASIA